MFTILSAACISVVSLLLVLRPAAHWLVCTALTGICFILIPLAMLLQGADTPKGAMVILLTVLIILDEFVVLAMAVVSILRLLTAFDTPMDGPHRPWPGQDDVDPPPPVPSDDPLEVLWSLPTWDSELAK